MALEVGKNTWIDLEGANEYMATRLGSERYWATGVSKEAALITAYNFLTAGERYEYPEDISLNMKNAQCEMALFLLQHQKDMDARMGLQAQGVKSAGIVEETYKEELDNIPMPPIVERLLSVYDTGSSKGAGFQALDAERDDEED